MRGGAAKVEPMSRGGEPWRAVSPREPRASVGLNRRRGVADSRGEQTPEGGDVSAGLSDPVSSGPRTAGSRRFGAVSSVNARHFGVAGSSASRRFGVACSAGFQRLGVGSSAGPRYFGTGGSMCEAGARGRRFGDGLGCSAERRVHGASAAGTRRSVLAAPDEMRAVSAACFDVRRWSGSWTTGFDASAADHGVGRPSGVEERASVPRYRDPGFGSRVSGFGFWCFGIRGRSSGLPSGVGRRDAMLRHRFTAKGARR
jgi:hypothetical protein